MPRYFPLAYIWPNRTCLSFSLPEKTESGQPTNRVYFSIYVYEKKKKSITLYIYKRAIELYQNYFDDYVKRETGLAYDGWGSLPVEIKDTDSWQGWENKLSEILEYIRKSWEEQMARID